ncbi:hypothetical protein [Rhodohalobacter sulfatireducens]|uniref:Uncharacterized protein n=1 Tax=Rhodohalobacter sulfatireducens TaxID=2911366 RepID=A0ABS9K8M3_9BACT|nr:hypothetical protein [Rhodohalobacter sulfatireducens]MCG2587200.1 hypothetical protein [Rhodohalobacter sulfatireducens]
MDIKVLTPRFHGYLDYLTVVIFLTAPLLLGLEGLSAIISYLLAAIYLLMTFLTDFSLGFAKLIPIKTHGWVETVAGPLVLLLPFVVGLYETARIFYITMGVLMIVVSLLTDYKQASLDIEDISV